MIKDETEIVAALIDALETTKFELLTLYPRLTKEYQDNDARQFYESVTP